MTKSKGDTGEGLSPPQAREHGFHALLIGDGLYLLNAGFPTFAFCGQCFPVFFCETAKLLTAPQFMLRMAIIQAHEQHIRFLNKAKALVPGAAFLITENIPACQDSSTTAMKPVEYG